MDEETEEQRISAVIVFQFLRIIIATNCILCYLPLDLTLPPYNYKAVRNSAESKYIGVEIVFFNMQIVDFFLKG